MPNKLLKRLERAIAEYHRSQSLSTKKLTKDLTSKFAPRDAAQFRVELKPTENDNIFDQLKKKKEKKSKHRKHKHKKQKNHHDKDDDEEIQPTHKHHKRKSKHSKHKVIVTQNEPVYDDDHGQPIVRENVPIKLQTLDDKTIKQAKVQQQEQSTMQKAGTLPIQNPQKTLMTKSTKASKINLDVKHQMSVDNSKLDHSEALANKLQERISVKTQKEHHNISSHSNRSKMNIKENDSVSESESEDAPQPKFQATGTLKGHEKSQRTTSKVLKPTYLDHHKPEHGSKKSHAKPHAPISKSKSSLVEESRPKSQQVVYSKVAQNQDLKAVKEDAKQSLKHEVSIKLPQIDHPVSYKSNSQGNIQKLIKFDPSCTDEESSSGNSSNTSSDGSSDSSSDSSKFRPPVKLADLDIEVIQHLADHTTKLNQAETTVYSKLNTYVTDIESKIKRTIEFINQEFQKDSDRNARFMKNIRFEFDQEILIRKREKTDFLRDMNQMAQQVKGAYSMIEGFFKDFEKISDVVA